ncbi:MAG: hypothetical protein ACK4HV_02895 [Parachlamydiaceae bacterium]
MIIRSKADAERFMLSDYLSYDAAGDKYYFLIEALGVTLMRYPNGAFTQHTKGEPSETPLELSRVYQLRKYIHAILRDKAST